MRAPRSSHVEHTHPACRYVTHVPEEAERGEFYAAELRPGAPLTAAVQLTRGAGRVDGIELSPDGTRALLVANFEEISPIAKHRSLWVGLTSIEWHRCDACSP